MKPLIAIAVVICSIYSGILGNEAYRNHQKVKTVDTAIADVMVGLQKVQDLAIKLEQTRCTSVIVYCTEDLGVMKLTKPTVIPILVTDESTR